MQNNVVVRGFKSMWKLIGRGYARKSRVGIKVCMRIYDKPFTEMKLKTK